MNNKIDLLVSFDTTGSMYPVLAQVRREVESFVKTMFSEFTDLRLGIIAHGDYCDKDDPYTIRAMELTRDEKKLCKFVKETAQTYGGDADECYELVLNVAHKDMSWRDDAEKIMIMIGDASPHSPSYHLNKDNLDWKTETDELRKNGIKVFSVHALAHYRSSSKAFYKYVAENTNGVYLTLDMFNEIVDLIKATCYQQGGEEKLNEFVTIIKDSGKMTRSMENNFKRLRGEEVEDTYESYRAKRGGGMSYRDKARATEDVTIKEMDKLVPVMPGRFQIMTVDDDTAIKAFVENNGIAFKKGRGFYELSKAETVQQYKEVIIMDRETGEMFNGSQVREELGLQPQSEKGGVKERIHKAAADKYRVFIQSTSVNRKLIAGTTFLYEVSDIEDTGTVIEEIKAPVKPVEETKKETSKKTEKKAKATKKPSKKVEKKETPVVEEIKPVEKKAKATKKPSKKAEKEVKTDVFDTLKPTKGIKVPEVDTEKAKTATRQIETATKRIEYTGLDSKHADKLVKSFSKVEDAIGRCKVSTNKKNTTFMKNNLTALIKEAEALLKELD